MKFLYPDSRKSMLFCLNPLQEVGVMKCWLFEGPWLLAWRGGLRTASILFLLRSTQYVHYTFFFFKINRRTIHCCLFRLLKNNSGRIFWWQPLAMNDDVVIIPSTQGVVSHSIYFMINQFGDLGLEDSETPTVHIAFIYATLHPEPVPFDRMHYLQAPTIIEYIVANDGQHQMIQSTGKPGRRPRPSKATRSSHQVQRG